MVDLVKIRQKAREKKEAEEPPSGESASQTGKKTKKGSSKAGKKTKPGARKGAKKSGRAEEKEPRRESSTKGTPRKPKEKPDAPAAEDSAPSESTPPTVEPESSPKVASDTSVERVEPGGETKLSRFKRTAGVMDASGGDEEEAKDETALGEEQLELITFSLAGEQYAMEVDRLVEIIVPRASTRVPNAGNEIIGIISLRGSIVTLLDLRKILGLAGAGEETEDTRIIVVQKATEQIGFIVDRVLRVVKVDPDMIEPHPVVSASEQNEAVRGVVVTGDTITIYLDLERIVESV